jgi:hypothetical protein
VANGEFNTLFDDANVENIITTTTDHFAILVRLQSFDSAQDYGQRENGTRCGCVASLDF